MARRQSTVLLSNVYAGAEPLEESKTGDPNVICNGKNFFVISNLFIPVLTPSTCLFSP